MVCGSADAAVGAGFIAFGSGAFCSGAFRSEDACAETEFDADCCGLVAVSDKRKLAIDRWKSIQPVMPPTKATLAHSKTITRAACPMKSFMARIVAAYNPVIAGTPYHLPGRRKSCAEVKQKRYPE